MRRRARFDGERRAAAIDVVDGELVGAAIGAVVEGNLPVVGREARARRSVLRPDAQVVFLNADRVKAEAVFMLRPMAGCGCFAMSAM